MKSSLILGFAIAALTTNIAFASDGSNLTIDNLHKHMTRAETRLADNSSGQAISHLYSSMNRSSESPQGATTA